MPGVVGNIGDNRGWKVPGHGPLTSQMGGVGDTEKKLPQKGSVLTITGVTYDSVGAILGSCTVMLFKSNKIDGTDAQVDQMVSDASTGVYTFITPSPGESYYVVAYKDGTPVFGTTANTLIGT